MLAGWLAWGTWAQSSSSRSILQFVQVLTGQSSFLSLSSFSLPACLLFVSHPFFGRPPRPPIHHSSYMGESPERDLVESPNPRPHSHSPTMRSVSVRPPMPMITTTRFHVYIRDYLRRRNFSKTAEVFSSEAGIGEEEMAPAKAPQGLLFE